MPTKIYWIQHFDNGGSIGIMPRPRGGDWLEDEMKHFKRAHVSLLVSLLESEEIRELELQAEALKCAQYGIAFLHFPIRDRSIPLAANTFIKELSQRINDGEKVVIHCRMGIGRASIIAGSLLLLRGYKTAQILEKISAARGLKVPDTEEQVLWLMAMEDSK
jgi:protein-tyrosine phosphatase